MKTKKYLSLFIALVMCLTTLSAFAADAKTGGLLISPAPSSGVSVNYNGEKMTFDVNPIIEDGRTLVPFRAIFEAMGCAVDYSDENGIKAVFARRGEDSLSLVIGENKMYFTGREIALDVPAKIKDGRTLVPIRAISEAFECEVLWDDKTKTVSINPPKGYFRIKPIKLSDTIKDDDGSILIEAIAYYPYIENTDGNPLAEDINETGKLYAEEFIAEAAKLKEEAQMMREDFGADYFPPFTLEYTFDIPYNKSGILSIKTYHYIYTGGAHPSTMVDAQTYSLDPEKELSVSDVLDEKALGTSLSEYIYAAASKKLADLEVPLDESGRYDTLDEELALCYFYLTEEALMICYNQGQIAPYAAGPICIEIPYDKDIFLIDIQ